MMTVFIKLKELKRLDFIYTVFFLPKNQRKGQQMLSILLIASFVINIAVILILFQIICYGTKKYIKERIKRNLELLDKLEEIEKDIDNKVDGLKIMIYDRYLDRCRAGMKKQREEDKGLRDKLVEIENKYSK